MDQYIHDNTEDELTHEVFINAYLASKGADTVDLDDFAHCQVASNGGAANRTANEHHAAHGGHELVDSLSQPHKKS